MVENLKINRKQNFDFKYFVMIVIVLINFTTLRQIGLRGFKIEFKRNFKSEFFKIACVGWLRSRKIIIAFNTKELSFSCQEKNGEDTWKYYVYSLMSKDYTLIYFGPC